MNSPSMAANVSDEQINLVICTKKQRGNNDKTNTTSIGVNLIQKLLDE